ncbi:MAG TPA: sterol desaturase family protein [Thermoanaerobaculia bacterium]|nr:sterol desaturase family protein [Thermoanaerobaculia bacterium]
MNIGRTLIALGMVGLVFALLERVAGALPAKSLFRRRRLVDFAYWFFTPWVSKTAATVAVFLTIGALAAQPSSGWFDSQPFAVQVLELLVIGDLLGYASHRLFHGRTLWKFHAIHHSAEDVDWLSAARLHPVNEIGSRVMQVVPMYLLGFRGTPLATAVPILAFYAILLHANLKWDFGPLRYVIASPAFHRWHHTSEHEGLDKNFAGLFPWIDALFGTLYLPRGRQPQRFGVAGEHMPGTLLGQLAYPFRATATSAAADAPRC